jgi:L-histidine Nalpha-methyltransferase
MALIAPPTLTTHAFHTDVVRGLSAQPKYLQSKYFYDAAGDALFRQIMACPEYYLTRAEEEILRLRSREILQVCAATHPLFDIVELGAGDASKTVHLLEEAVRLGCSSRYLPIDISAHTIAYLTRTLPERLGGRLQVEGLNGEYFPMLERVQAEPQPKLALFLGSNIGNMLPAEATAFCRQLRAYLNPGDWLLMGIDLKKDPRTILAAYHDAQGITRAFNLNLLHRINRELGADFQVDHFLHYPVYDPLTGSCKSYLVSTCRQRVTLADGTAFDFAAHEPIHMEVSQKYSEPEIEALADAAGFEAVRMFFDEQHRFTDVLWRVPA